MNSYLITDITWYTSECIDESQYDELGEDVLPSQVIVQTSLSWSEDLNETIFEELFDGYGWEPRTFSHEVLDNDDDLLKELDIIEI